MSKEWFSKWWILTKDQLAELRKYDKFMKDTTKTTRSRSLANYLVSGLYVKYCMLVQDMDSCLDQMAQVQKSVTMRKLMDAAVTRLRELKELLKEIDLSEIHYVDGALIELKLIPHDIEILDPALMFPRPENIQDMWEAIQKGERIYTAPPPPPPLSLPEAEEMTSLERLLNPQQEKTAEEKPSEEKPPEDKPPEEAKAPPQEQPKEEKKSKKKPVKKFVIEPKVLTEEELEAIKKREERNSIVKLIQKHERARQARLYFLDRRTLKKKTPTHGMTVPVKEVHPDPFAMNKAATDFQKIYRGYRARNNMQKREISRRLLIGMVSPSWRSHEELDKVQRTIERRRDIVKQHIRDFIDANIKEKDRVMRVVAPGLMEDIGDEIREWFYQWYIRAKCFDKIPAEEKGGTVLVVRCETFTPEEYLDDVEKKRREKEKNKNKGDKAKQEAEKKKKEAEKKKQEAEKKKKEKALKEKERKRKQQDFEFKFEESPAAKLVLDGTEEYKTLWSDRKDEDNPEDKVYMDLITDQKCFEMQLEVRKKVDEMMRIELDLLNEALALDKAKGKKKKPKKPKKGKKGKKGKRGKKKKDLTGNRTTEDLFQELVDNGIIHTYPMTPLSEFRGDMSYCNWDKRNNEYDPPAALGDIRQTVALTCILPLGVEAMKKRPRSVLIAGPRQSGKHLLAKAIFTETKCVLFDLSPPVLAGKYQSKKEMKLLVHLINKMSRLLQPSIIYIDGAEKPFYKKVPAVEKDQEPKKMGKQLFKGIVKTIKPEDRVLLLGITKQPWAAKAAGLKKAFEKVILIPRTDYGSAYMYLYELLMGYHAVDRNIQISSLARLAVNYPLGQLKTFVDTLMQPRRIIQLAYNPLTQMEIYNLMISWKEGPVSDKEYKKFIKWYGKTPLGKRKAKLMKIIEKKREMEAAQAEKQKRK